MKKIPLVNRWMVTVAHAYVDNEQYDHLRFWDWHLRRVGKHQYAARYLWNGGRCSKVYMHRVIARPADGQVVDHVNGDGLDNRKSNLRICSDAQNRLNTGKGRNNTSGYKGVSWSKAKRKWEVHITFNKHRRFLGLFTNAEAGHRAYVAAGKKLHGEFFHA